MHRRSFLTRAVGSTAGTAIAAPAIADGARTMTWTVACDRDAEPEGISGLLARAGELVGRMSDGQFDVRLLQAAELPCAPLEALLGGSIDACCACGDAMSAQAPALALTAAAPFGPDPARLREWLNHASVAPHWQAALDPLGVRFLVIGSFESGLGCWSTREIRGADDLRGLRIAAHRRTHGLLEALGARPIHAPWADVAGMLRTGEIDACESRGAVLDEQAGVFRGTVCYRPWVSQGSVAALLLIGAHTFARLGTRERTMLESALALASNEFFAQFREHQASAALRIASAGAVFSATSRPVVDLAYAAAQDWLTRSVGADPSGARLLAAWRAWRDAGTDPAGESADPLRRYMAAGALSSGIAGPIGQSSEPSG